MKKNLRLFVLLLWPLSVLCQERVVVSTLETYNIETGKRSIILKEKNHFEAPNWDFKDKYLVINQKGLLYKVNFDGKGKELIPTENLKKCNNDHGISFDGKFLAISNNDSINGTTSGTSRIYTMPLTGGEPKLITPLYPSYWHGWSPDGKSIVYTAKRGDNFDIYNVSLNGGDEIRLTNSPSLDDGPEFSPDGENLYYNSAHSGSMEIWRMKADGSQKEQLTNDIYSNWFAHPSPNGNYLVFISYVDDQGEKHPPMKRVVLRLYNLKDGSIKNLCEFTGGQGTINVPSWSPNGKQFAFVSYEFE